MRRRELLLGVVASFLSADANAESGEGIAAIDWAMLETVIALGVMPIAASELIQFRKDAVEPAIPRSVVDLGLRGSPNLELLHLLKPEMILISPFYTRHQASLELIAPVISLEFYVRGQPPVEKSLAAVQMLGDRLGRPEIAARVLGEFAHDLAEMKQALARFSVRPFYLVNIGDARHVRIFGSDSMFGDILVRLGLRNAWKDRSRYTFAAPVPIEELAAEKEAHLVVISEVPVEARSTLRSSVIWNSLPPVREGRVTMLDNINPYGGVLAGMRFARLLQDALLAADDGR